ncbi:hypothetical protein QEM35_000270 [Pseudomonas putida]|nr:hypothetical protein [Pseudomonas putida]EKT4511231.1 hypothetical protein [Pseudomonas putida]
MTIDKEKLKSLAEAAIKQHQEWVAAGEPWPVWNRYLMELYGTANPAVILALLAEIERLTKFEDWFVRLDQVEQSLAASFKAERDQLKAENEALRKALGEISGQVDGNIRCAVRDVVNCRGDVQDIYGYCDNIDEIIEAAMAKEASHG